jgi:hypothetical protein
MKVPFYYKLLLLVAFVLVSCTYTNKLSPANQQSDDAQIAQLALVSFLEDLHDGKYEQAAQLYGGSYDTMLDHNPGIDPANHPALIQNACTINGAQCLEVKSAILDREVSASEYSYQVEFLNSDGTQFVLSPCCGGNETDSPTQASFIFTVIKDEDGNFLVMDMPPYMP